MYQDICAYGTHIRHPHCLIVRDISSYEPSPIFKAFHFFAFTIKDGWVYGENCRIKLGEPATGLEQIEFLPPSDVPDTIKNDEDYKCYTNPANSDKWIYYTTNRLLKIRANGGEIIELDGPDDYWCEINKVDGDWIYYRKSEMSYRIKTDGTEKMEGWE
ncbi:hypothetical protein FACS1894202_10770 [Clostridia bacterium]|nr:hypothetical protein FACS1894202_10770 [Clostridia bacterium]